MSLLHKPDDSPVDVDGKEIELVPLALLAGELGEPIDELARRLGDDVVRDDLGLRAVAAAVAASTIAARDDLAAEHRRLAERNAAVTRATSERHRVRGRGIPAAEGLTAVETMLAADGPPEWKTARVSPTQEYLDGIGRDR